MIHLPMIKVEDESKSQIFNGYHMFQTNFLVDSFVFPSYVQKYQLESMSGSVSGASGGGWHLVDTMIELIQRLQFWAKTLIYWFTGDGVRLSVNI